MQIHDPPDPFLEVPGFEDYEKNTTLQITANKFTIYKISIVLGKGKQFWTHDKLEMKLFIQSATSLDSRHEVNKLGNIEGDFHK